MINNTMALGMIHGGAVQHVIKDSDKSACGRYVVVAGESSAPLCKSCARITGYALPVAATDRPLGECTRDHVHKTMAPWEGQMITPYQLSLFRDVVDDYNKGHDNAPCWIAVCRTLLANGAKMVTPDIKTPELTKRQGGHNPNAGLIDPNSKSVAKTRKRGCGASEKQEKLIRDLISQIREMNSEAADVLDTIYTDAWINDTKWADISAGIDALFAILSTEKRKARESQTQEIKSAREWRRNQVYVIDGVFHRVHISQSTGRPYTQSWNGGAWVYQGMKFLKDCTDATACTAAQAKAWAHEHDSCVFCHKPLDDQRSREAGYGSTCADNNGLPWGE